MISRTRQIRHRLYLSLVPLLALACLWVFDSDVPDAYAGDTIPDDVHLFLPSAFVEYDGRTWIGDCVVCPKPFYSMTERSLALDSNGHPHVIYGGDQLYYAWFDGTDWHDTTVVDYPNVGNYPSLALDADDVPHISYVDRDNREVKYARWNGSEWTTETLGVSQYGDTSLAMDDSGVPHVVHVDSVSGNLYHSHYIDDDWQTEFVTTAGFDNALVLDSNNSPHILHTEFASSGLTYVYWDEDSWVSESISSGALAINSSIVVDEDDVPHVAFYDSDLIYGIRTEGTWHTEIVDVNVEGYPESSSSLVLDSEDRPHIGYVDHPRRTLRYATKVDSEWHTEAAGPSSYFCGSASLALDDDNRPHIACHDHEEGGLYYTIRRAVE